MSRIIKKLDRKKWTKTQEKKTAKKFKGSSNLELLVTSNLFLYFSLLEQGGKDWKPSCSCSRTLSAFT